MRLPSAATICRVERSGLSATMLTSIVWQFGVCALSMQHVSNAAIKGSVFFMLISYFQLRYSSHIVRSQTVQQLAQQALASQTFTRGTSVPRRPFGRAAESVS